MRRRTVAVVTGTRAEFGLLVPVMRAIRAHPRLRLKVIATGMHFDRSRGYTVREILNEGFTIDASVRIPAPSDSFAGYGRSLVRMFQGIRRVLSDMRPDWLVVLGDRAEPLAAAAATREMRIAIAHLHGGEVTGHARDNTARDILSRLAHLHLAATPRSRSRLLGLGEEAWRIHVVGGPGLDGILSAPLPAPREVRKRVGLPPKGPYLLLVQHAVPQEALHSAAQIGETLEACRRLALPVLASSPNTDEGGAAVQRALALAHRQGRIRLVPSLLHADYLALLKGAAVLLGNSSSGIIEAPAFRTPVVNLGVRQAGRERAANVIDAPHRASAIVRAVRKAMSPAFRRKIARVRSPYGDGKTAPRVAKLLATLPIDRKLLEKSHA